MNKYSKGDVLVGLKKTISFIGVMALMSLITIMESLNRQILRSLKSFFFFFGLSTVCMYPCPRVCVRAYVYGSLSVCLRIWCVCVCLCVFVYSCVLLLAIFLHARVSLHFLVLFFQKLPLFTSVPVCVCAMTDSFPSLLNH